MNRKCARWSSPSSYDMPKTGDDADYTTVLARLRLS